MTVSTDGQDLAGDRDNEGTAGSNKSVALSSIWRLSARIISSAALGVCLLLTARATPIVDFGAMMTAYSSGLIIGLVAGIGAPTRVLRAPAEQRSVVGALFIVHTAMVVGAFIVAFAICGLVWPKYAVAAGLMFALGDTVQNYAQGHMTSLDLQRSANCLVLLQRVIPLCVVLVCFFMVGHVDYALLTGAFAVPVILALVVPWKSASRSGFSSLGEVFHNWFGYWAYSGSAVMAQLQIPVLGFAGTAATVGVFAMATRVVGPITLLTASLTAVVVPEMARRLPDPKAFHSLYRLMLIVVFGYFVLVAVFAFPAGWAVVRLAGPQYAGAVPLVVGTIIGAGLSACAQGFNAKLLAVGRPGLATVPVVTGGAVALLMLLGLGWSGAVGYLWTVPVVSQMVVLAMMVKAANDESLPGIGRHRRSAR